MKMILAVAFGSATGGVARFLLSAWLEQRAASSFPWPTLLVNITWTFETAGVSPELRALLTTGLCGGYTTFSTFSLETFALAEEGQWSRAGAYIALSVIISIAAAAAGISGARHFVSARTP